MLDRHGLGREALLPRGATVQNLGGIASPSLKFLLPEVISLNDVKLFRKLLLFNVKS